MPTLSNQRHEAFARLVARGEPASTSYSGIYHVSDRVAETNGSRLLRNAQVSQRVGELKEMAAKQTTKTVESLVSELDAVIEFARKCGNPNAMVSAIGLQAKLLGLMAPTQLEIIRHAPAPLPTKLLELSEAEWRAQFGGGTGPKPALIDSAKRLKAAKRQMNGRPRDGNRDVVAAPAITRGIPVNTIEVPRRGAIDLD